MVILNNLTNSNLGPYNGLTVPANGTAQIPTAVAPYISDGTLLGDILSGSISVTYSQQTAVSAAAAALLIQLGQILNTDSDGASLSRVKQAPAGWTYQLRGFEFTTSTANSLINNDSNNAPLLDATITFYDINNNVLTDPSAISSNAVKTVVDWEPPYDYYIIGGSAKISVQPTNNVRLSVVAVPDVLYSAGGSRVMVQNMNFKFMMPDDAVRADGRASKALTYNATYHTNKLRFLVYHNAGDINSIAVSLELFWE